MHRLLLLSAVYLMTSQALLAQLNMVLRDTFPYDDASTDIWGYVAPNGTEYAIVGLENGVSFIDLSDPDNLVEAASIVGQSSRWRDMKTFGDYAYVVADQSGTTEGLTIIDLSDLANGNLTVTHNNYDIGEPQVLNKAHNIYIDTTKGYAFIAGSNASNGNLVFDIATTPGEAIYLNTVGENYAHDVYVNDNILFASEINAGRLSIWDISDINNPIELGATFTPFAFTHNAWSTPDNNYVFTTDERGNASVAAYDISNPADPILLDEYRPLYSLGTNTVPHNVHVLNQYLINSYYTDGVTVVDASEPTNLIEVANWDTWLEASGGTNGNWGAYPFLPSGLILATDRQHGLFVLEPDLKRAARLEGTITDDETGVPLNNVTVAITSTQVNSATTDATGFYNSGLADAGTYDVTFSKDGFLPLTLSTELSNGNTIVLDTTLVSSQVRFPFNGTVLEEGTSAGVAGATILLQGGNEDIIRSADENGVANFELVPEGVYDVYVARWGYRELLVEDLNIDAATNQIFELPVGYEDGFQVDQGWVAIQESSTGLWERGLPIGTTAFGEEGNPGQDAAGDLGDFAYVTGNGGGTSGFDDVDDGNTILQSPIFDLSAYEPSTVELHYQYWYFNFGAQDTGVDPNDPYIVSISNGQTSVQLAHYLAGEPGLGWRADSFRLADSLELTAQMQLTISTSDFSPGNIIEGGFDDFFIAADLVSSTENIALTGLKATVAPNPSSSDFQFSYQLPSQTEGQISIEVLDLLGRSLELRELAPTLHGVLNFGQDLTPGVYLLRMLQNGQPIYSTKLIKQ